MRGGQVDEDAGAALVDGGRDADAAGEEIAEAAEAGEADLHADIGDGAAAAREQELGAVDAGLDAVLVGSDAEEEFELADEVEGRDADLAGDVADGERFGVNLIEEFPALAEAAKEVVAQEHEESVAGGNRAAVAATLARSPTQRLSSRVWHVLEIEDVPLVVEEKARTTANTGSPQNVYLSLCISPKDYQSFYGHRSAILGYRSK